MKTRNTKNILHSSQKQSWVHPFFCNAPEESEQSVPSHVTWVKKEKETENNRNFASSGTEAATHEFLKGAPNGGEK